MNSYADVLQKLNRLQWFGARFGLETIRELASAAGHPETGLRFIHIAGTNGKGSTAAMLESIYRKAGYRTGLFTSPHLVSFRERIQVDRQWITEQEVVEWMQPVSQILQTFPADRHPTFFEAVTLLALLHFQQKKCNLVIWETGLGGRLDATNIVTPLASIITNIDLDHQQWLGDTLDKIAFEKAGIIKPGIPIIAGPMSEMALTPIRKVARENSAPIHEVSPAIATRFPLPLFGEHQQRNAAVALKTVDVLRPVLPVNESIVLQGLAATSWPGRFQQFRVSNRIIVVDGAHNPAGWAVLLQSLDVEFPTLRPAFIFGALQDKNWRETLQALAGRAGVIYVTAPDSPRAAAIPDVVAAARSLGLQVERASHVAAALWAASAEPLVVIAGSFYLVGEALKILDPAFANVADEHKLNDWSGGVAKLQNW